MIKVTFILSLNLLGKRQAFKDYFVISNHEHFKLSKTVLAFRILIIV